jgi:hypothetical protein
MVTEVTSEESWLQRIGRSIMGVLFGIVLLVVGVVLIFWNEGRAVKRHKTLQEGAGAVVSVAADQLSPGNEGKLVHFTAEATTDEQLRDPMFGVSATALKLQRKVEMYQWVEHEKSETKKKTGGGTKTVTTYTYDKEWVSHQVDSSSFQETGHDNPSMPFLGDEWVAGEITAGAFTLTDIFKGKLNRSEPLQVSADHLGAVSADVGQLLLDGGGFYRPVNPAAGGPSSPQIGDVRIQWGVVMPAIVSMVGKQENGMLGAYRTKAGGDIDLLSYGTKAAAEMFAAAEAANKMMTWILRAVGIFVLFIGFAAIFKPLSVLADVIPFIGNLVEKGTGLIAFGLALMIGLLTIAVGWIFYRPLLGIGLLVAVVVVAVLLFRRGKKGKAAAAPAAAPPPPPPPAG